MPAAPWNRGRFELEGGPDGATCRPTTRQPDLELTANELGRRLPRRRELPHPGRRIPHPVPQPQEARRSRRHVPRRPTPLVQRAFLGGGAEERRHSWRSGVILGGAASFLAPSYDLAVKKNRAAPSSLRPSVRPPRTARERERTGLPSKTKGRDVEPAELRVHSTLGRGRQE